MGLGGVSGHPWRGLWGQVTRQLTVKKLVSEGRRGPEPAPGSGHGAFFTPGLGTRGHFQSHAWLWTEHSFSPFERLALPCAGLRGPGEEAGHLAAAQGALSLVPVPRPGPGGCLVLL